MWRSGWAGDATKNPYADVRQENEGWDVLERRRGEKEERTMEETRVGIAEIGKCVTHRLRVLRATMPSFEGWRRNRRLNQVVSNPWMITKQAPQRSALKIAALNA